MEMNVREIWTVVHGMVFGLIFLLGFSGALYAVYSLKAEWLTTEGMTKTVNIIKVYLWSLPFRCGPQYLRAPGWFTLGIAPLHLTVPPI